MEIKMGKKVSRAYEPPVAVDLTGFSVAGQQGPAAPGICESGGQLTFQYCTDGNYPVGGNCSPTGTLPAKGYCRIGNSAVEGCTSGGIHS